MLADGHDLVVVGGGGTVTYDAGRVAGTNVMLGVLPLGTAKHFAGTLQIPNNLAEACAAVADGKVVDIDLGRANGEPFLNGCCGRTRSSVRTTAVSGAWNRGTC